MQYFITHESGIMYKEVFEVSCTNLRELYQSIVDYSKGVVIGLELTTDNNYLIEMNDGPLPIATVYCDNKVIETISGSTEVSVKSKVDNVIDFQDYKNKRKYEEDDLEHYSEEILWEISGPDWIMEDFDKILKRLHTMGPEAFWAAWGEDMELEGDSLYLDKHTGQLEWKGPEDE